MNTAVAKKPTPVITLISERCQALLSNQASLPSMPDVAARIHAAMSNPNWSVSTIADVIKSDPGTTTYLLQLANSAMYGGVSSIQEVERAIARIGMDNTRNFVMAHALRSVFKTESGILSGLMQKTRRRSARLAALSAVLARRFSRLSPDRALIAGLLQDVGVLPILNVLNDFHAQLKDEAQVLGVIDRYAAKIGQILLTQWGFDPELIEVARSRGDWMRDRQPEPDVADLVLLVRLHDNLVEGTQHDIPRIDEVPAYSKFVLGELLPDSSLAYSEDEQAAVAELVRALGAD